MPAWFYGDTLTVEEGPALYLEHDWTCVASKESCWGKKSHVLGLPKRDTRGYAETLWSIQEAQPSRWVALIGRVSLVSRQTSSYWPTSSRFAYALISDPVFKVDENPCKYCFRGKVLWKMLVGNILSPFLLSLLPITVVILITFYCIFFR